MGLVIRFPLEQRITRCNAYASEPTEPASVIILPVIRVDRYPDEPSGGVAPGTNTPSGRGRRRRASRS
jgi:hypothetical protein